MQAAALALSTVMACLIWSQCISTTLPCTREHEGETALLCQLAPQRWSAMKASMAEARHMPRRPEAVCELLHEPPKF